MMAKKTTKPVVAPVTAAVEPVAAAPESTVNFHENNDAFIVAFKAWAVAQGVADAESIGTDAEWNYAAVQAAQCISLKRSEVLYQGTDVVTIETFKNAPDILKEITNQDFPGAAAMKAHYTGEAIEEAVEAVEAVEAIEEEVEEVEEVVAEEATTEETPVLPEAETVTEAPAAPVEPTEEELA